VTATGTTLTIYASAQPGSADSSDVLAAERLAFRQFQQQAGGGRIGKFTVKFAATGGAKTSDNARTAIEDRSSIAYIGELEPGGSADSAGITNGEDLLQVTPTDTALELTQATPAVPGAPDNYYESLKSYGPTFARVVPNSAKEAAAQVQEMTALGVKKLYVTDDGSAYGAAIAHAVREDAASTLAAVEGPPDAARFQSSGADGLFYGAGAASSATVARLFEGVATATPGVKLFAPSALDQPAFAASLGSARLGVYVSSPGFLPGNLVPEGKTFAAAFTAAYGRAPAVDAIFGYEAVQAVLAVLQEAGSSANNRATVVHDFFAIRNRSSALGTYSIDSRGDTSLAPFVFSRLRAGKLVPFVQLQG
jgi:hypothetical protein